MRQKWYCTLSIAFIIDQILKTKTKSLVNWTGVSYSPLWWIYTEGS